ncbi:MAG: hypothetical protein IT369_02420 [Candidatus Latescibacteria bacterium]|nr:hypothetical protein [Candidatus Latescibacterota bacterium]
MVTPLLQDDLYAGIGPRFIKRQNHNAGISRIKDGLGIAPLRATGGPPSVISGAAAPQTDPSPGLFDLPASGEGMLSSLAAQTDSVSPLTAGLADQGQDPTPLHLLQAGQLNLRRHLQGAAAQSRLLQAAANPRRTQGGFGMQFTAASIDLLG